LAQEFTFVSVKACHMGGKKKQKVNVVYSTNPDFGYEYDDELEEETLSAKDQMLYVSLDRKQRKGKTVTLVEGFVGTKDDLKDLGKILKTHCGSGGSVVERDILVQGDHRDKVMAKLEQLGYRTKRKGG